MRKHIAIGILSIMLARTMQAMPATETVDTTAHMLNDVEVKSIKAAKPVVSSAPLHIIDRSKMLHTGVTNVSDAVHRMPGVTLRDYGGAGGLKTVSVRGFGAAHTGVIYDGIPLSDAQSGQIDLSRYSTDNLKSVTMVIGDNDDIFIPARIAASSATFSLSSLPSAYTPELEAKLKAGAWGYISPFLRAGGPISENFRINFNGEYTHADNDYPFKLVNGEYTITERRNNSRMNSLHAEINTVWTPGSSTTLSSKIYFYDNTRRLPGPVIIYNDVSRQRLHEQNVFAQARLIKSISPTLSLAANAKYNFASSKYSDENGIYPNGKLQQNYWQREYYASACLLFSPTREWTFDYSGDFFHNSLNSNLATDTRPYRNSVLQSATVRLRTRQITVMARALYSIYLNGAKDGTASRDEHKLSPSVSISAQPWSTQQLYIRAMYKNIFRMPTFSESYFDHLGSLELLPEDTRQINVGVTYSMRPFAFVSDATLTFDTYINNITNMIVGVPYNMFVWRMVNLSKVRTVGIDATANICISVDNGHNLIFSANYSYQRAQPRTSRESSEWGKQVAYIPKSSGNAALAYENPWCNISVNAIGVSDRYTTNNNIPSTRIKGYIECGASIWRDFALHGHNIGIKLDLMNILDKQYEVVARYPMPGRSWQFSVSYSL